MKMAKSFSDVGVCLNTFKFLNVEVIFLSEFCLTKYISRLKWVFPGKKNTITHCSQTHNTMRKRQRTASVTQDKEETKNEVTSSLSPAKGLDTKSCITKQRPCTKPQQAFWATINNEYTPASNLGYLAPPPRTIFNGCQIVHWDPLDWNRRCPQKKLVWAMWNCMVSMATHSEFEKGGLPTKLLISQLLLILDY